MKIPVGAVKELRNRTNAGILECSKAVAEVGGDMERAVEILKRRGAAIAEKKKDAAASEGVIKAYIHHTKRIGALVELNCQTDFAAHTPEFEELAYDLAMQVAASSPQFLSGEEMPPGAQTDPQAVCLLSQPFIKEPSKTVQEVIAETIAKTMADAEGVKDVQIQFSGDRGFYVKGIMSEKMDINAARSKVKNLMQGLDQRPDVTLGKAKVDQIRIDTTPFKYRGSIKAPYSLSAQTGLVAAPVKLEDLPGMRKTDFRIEKIKTAAKKKEFAPGIPMAKTIDPIPSIKNKAWFLSVQKHDAHKAGKHYDLRLTDPKTDKAHSFAVPKARLPGKRDRMLLAIQQPTHTSDYALNFEGNIPMGTYGAGEVTMAIKPEKINVVKANADRIVFERQSGDQFALFRTKGNSWGFKRKKA